MLLKNSTPLFIVRFFSPGTKDEKHMHMHVLPHVICIKQMNKERNKNTESSSWVAVYVCSYPLAISQVDLPKSGVKVWRGLALMVLIQEYRRTADLYAQLLCALTDADTETRRKTCHVHEMIIRKKDLQDFLIFDMHTGMHGFVSCSHHRMQPTRNKQVLGLGPFYFCNCSIKICWRELMCSHSSS